MKVLITGVKGQLGSSLYHLLVKEHEVYGIDKEEVDITNEKKIESYILSHHPEIVLHTAAYTAVDKAEEHQIEAYDVNVNGTKYIAKACQKIKAKMVYISTDYVFDGEGDCPYETTSKPNPINYYGYTKFLGECEVKRYMKHFFIIRISRLFGENGMNFVETMLKLERNNKKIRVVCDQIGSPTYTKDLGELISKMIISNHFGIYHATNEGFCSWYDFACEIFKQCEKSVIVEPILSKDYKTMAKRPKNSRLSKDILSNAGFNLLPHWKEALRNYLNNRVEIE